MILEIEKKNSKNERKGRIKVTKKGEKKRKKKFSS